MYILYCQKKEYITDISLLETTAEHCNHSQSVVRVSREERSLCNKVFKTKFVVSYFSEMTKNKTHNNVGYLSFDLKILTFYEKFRNASQRLKKGEIVF